jgi:hypothetical protein
MKVNEGGARFSYGNNTSDKYLLTEDLKMELLLRSLSWKKIKHNSVLIHIYANISHMQESCAYNKPYLTFTKKIKNKHDLIYKPHQRCQINFPSDASKI